MKDISSWIDLLQCPKNKSSLYLNDSHLESGSGSQRYPLIHGIPILINSSNSIFSIKDFTSGIETTSTLKQNVIRKYIKKMIPSISINIRAADNYKKLNKMLPLDAKVLVVGGGVLGDGMEQLYSNNNIQIIGSDVTFGPYVDFICDGHDIPFKNEVFDCVIIQAVLEHVLDPHRCVNEIHRVLKSSGIVYAETPFMQQVHMKQYDFTRFTNLGHIRLFRSFTELDSGPSAGPGVALAWSISYFLKSFFSSRFAIEVVTALSRFIVFPLKYIDYYLLNKPGGYDAASGFFFLGRKSKNQLTDRELIKKFKGNTV